MLSDSFRRVWRNSRLFFIHVPKTGGTSLYALLSRLYGPDQCREHLENVLRPAPLPDLIASLLGCRVVSAHVPLECAAPFVASGFWPITAMRDSVGQFHSHINHIVMEAPLGGMLGEIQRKASVSTGHFLDTATEEELEFFENPQSKAVFGTDSGWRDISVSGRLARLRETYAAVLTTETMESELRRLDGLPPDLVFPRLNVKQYASQGLTPRQHGLLDDLVAEDQVLHRALLLEVGIGHYSVEEGFKAA